jgi:hypothetical protein
MGNNKKRVITDLRVHTTGSRCFTQTERGKRPSSNLEYPLLQTYILSQKKLAVDTLINIVIQTLKVNCINLKGEPY